LLKQCSLVSSSFLLPSRKQLFSRITLRSDETCQGIHRFLVQNPFIQSFVRAITLSDRRSGNFSQWMNGCNGTSLLAILRLPFCCLEFFSINLYSSLRARGPKPWNWNNFSSELKDALSKIILSSNLKTLSLKGIIKVPITQIVHLTTLELHSVSVNDFDDENSSSLAGLKGVVPMASHTVIDRCVWRLREGCDGYEYMPQKVLLNRNSCHSCAVYASLKSTSTSITNTTACMASISFCPS